MGIPSYYRRLTGSVNGILHKTRPSIVVTGGVQKLLMDFNCLIYHVLRQPDRAPYPSMEDERVQWTDQLYDDIVRYTLRVIRMTGAEGVFIAVDGVVPMAKIRQQRMRRFKSAALSSGKSFDTNAITPGTQFMDGLKVRLEEMIVDEKKEGKWILSSADEPGEGEHKLLNHLRLCEPADDRSYVVYGLDGDLIVLLLWAQALGITGSAPVWLYREDIEGGDVKCINGEEQYVWFSINRLRDYLSDVEGVHIEDYCATMMLLGNDFIPSSLTFKIKDGGHTFLLGWLKREKGRFLENGQLNIDVWRRLFAQLAAVEERRFLEAIQKKWRTVAKNPAEEQPLEWRAEKIFLADADALSLRKDWRDVYCSAAFYSNAAVNVSAAVDAYYTTMAWIIDYYTGRPVAMDWMYAWNLPPLWEDIVRGGAAVAPNAVTVDIKAREQLALVLPAASWWLIRGDVESRFIEAAPEFFPRKFELESIGKRFNWECEAIIPIPTIHQLRAVIA